MISKMKPFWSFNWVQTCRIPQECLCRYWLSQSWRNVTKEIIDHVQERNVWNIKKEQKVSFCIALSLGGAGVSNQIWDTVVKRLVTHSHRWRDLCLLSTTFNDFFTSAKSFAQTKLYVYCKIYPSIVKDSLSLTVMLFALFVVKRDHWLERPLPD